MGRGWAGEGSGGRGLGNTTYHSQCGLQSKHSAGQRTGPSEMGDRGTLQAPGLCASFPPCCPGLPSAFYRLVVVNGPWVGLWVPGVERVSRGRKSCPAWLASGPVDSGYLSMELRAPRDPNLAICWKQRSSICISRPSALETKYFILASGLEPQRADQQT